MKNKILFIAALATLFAAPNVWACSQMSSEYALVHANDKNKDGKLSLKEWQHIQIKGYFVEMRAGDAREFARLDSDKNRQLTPEELSDKVRYRDEPCADWEAQSSPSMNELDAQNSESLDNQDDDNLDP